MNRDLTTWRRQIKAAVKLGQKPKKSVWGNRLSERGKRMDMVKRQIEKKIGIISKSELYDLITHQEFIHNLPACKFESCFEDFILSSFFFG